MKRRITTYILTVMLAWMAWSCSKDMSADAMPPTLISFGEILSVDETGYFEILRDDGDILQVSQYNGGNKVTAGERVRYAYMVIRQVGTKDPGPTKNKIYEVEIISFMNLMSKEILRQSDLDGSGEEEVGNDLVNIYKTDLTGNYINIEFEYMRYESETAHVFNLVWDDTSEDDGTVYLRFRHNAMGETPENGIDMHRDTGLCSFKLANLIPDGKSSINIKLLWNWNGKEEGEYSATGEFKPMANPTSGGRIVGNIFAPPANEKALIK